MCLCCPMGNGPAQCTLCSESHRLQQEAGEIACGERSGRERATRKPSVTRPAAPARPSKDGNGMPHALQGSDALAPPRCTVERADASRCGSVGKRDFAEEPAPMPAASRHEPDDFETPGDQSAQVAGGRAPGLGNAAESGSAGVVAKSPPIAPIAPPRLPSSSLIAPEVALSLVSESLPSSRLPLHSASISVAPPEARVVANVVSDGGPDHPVAVVSSEVSLPTAALLFAPGHPCSCAAKEAVPARHTGDDSSQQLVIDLGPLDSLVARLETCAARFGIATTSAVAVDVEARQRSAISDYALDLSALEDLVQRLECASDRIIAESSRA